MLPSMTLHPSKSNNIEIQKQNTLCIYSAYFIHRVTCYDQPVLKSTKHLLHSTADVFKVQIEIKENS